MYFVRTLFVLIAGTSLLFLLVGLVRPWIVLWWEDVQTRRKVLYVYGAALLLALSMFVLLQLW